MSAQALPRLTTPAPSGSGSTEPQRPEPTTIQPSQADPSTSNVTLRPAEATANKKRNNHRGGKKKKKRRQSFAASAEDGSGMPEAPYSHRVNPQSATSSSFYRLQGQNLSNTSIESEALQDHR